MLAELLGRHRHAHGAELTDDYNERTRVTVGREVFGLLGMMLAVVLPTILTAELGEELGYTMLGLVFLLSWVKVIRAASQGRRRRR